MDILEERKLALNGNKQKIFEDHRCKYHGNILDKNCMRSGLILFLASII